MSKSLALFCASFFADYLCRINVCDRPENYDKLSRDMQGDKGYHSVTVIDSNYAGLPGINVLRDGHQVSRTSDFIIYSVEAEYIDRVVAEYGPCV